MSLTDDSPTAPFPGKPVGADLHGDTLTIYWPQDPATGQYPQERIAAPYGGWTRKNVGLVLDGYGLTIADLRPSRIAAAFVTATERVLAVTERAAATIVNPGRAFARLTGGVA